MEKKTVSVGIAGFGHSARVFHAPFLSCDPDFELKKIYERTSDNASKEYPDVLTVRSFGELLTDDIDLVVLSIPNSLHYLFCMQAIAAGKHVVIEKPVALSSAEAEELRAAAEEKGVMLFPFHNRRLDGDYLTAKSVMGQLGDIVEYHSRYNRFRKGPSLKRWKTKEGDGFNVLLDLGTHLVDQAYALFGMPEEVYADLAVLREESPGWDSFHIILYYPDRMKAVLEGSETRAIPGPRLEMHGTEGSFVKETLCVQERDLLSGKKPDSPGWGEDLPEDYGLLRVYRDGKLTDSRVPTVPGNYMRFYDGLYDALRRGGRPPVSMEDAIGVLKILEACEESNRLKRRIVL